MTRQFAILMVLAFLACSPTREAEAYTFSLSDAEWSLWPDWCQGKYIATDIGERSPHALRLSHEQREAMMRRARQLLGQVGYTHIHHYCAGRIWLLRARRAMAAGGRPFNHAVASGISECRYAIPRIPPTHWVQVEMATTYALLLRLQGKPDGALAAVEEALRNHPSNPKLYSLRYLVLRDMGEETQAMEALQTGSKAAQGKYAEIEYFLGLEYLKRGEAEKAVEQARRAEALGYPLPGLKQKLQAQGDWPG